MKKIGILADSHSSITPEEAGRMGISVMPMPFVVDGQLCLENVTMAREDFMNRLREGADVSTSQPAPGDLMQFWDEALNEFEKVLYFPISSGLSGSCATAKLLAEEEPYAGRVIVVDNGRVSVLQHRAILDAMELIEEGYSAEEIRDILEQARDKMVIYIAMDTLEYLKKGGRITASAAAIGSILHIKPVLRFDVGILDTYQKCRGFVKAKKVMIEAMWRELTTTFRQWYEKGEVYLVAASSAAPEIAAAWVQEIREAFPGMEVLYDDLSLALSCHIGPGGLGIGCSCRPDRPGEKVLTNPTI